MIDHVSIGVTHLARSVGFYDAALWPLGLRRSAFGPRSAVYAGADGRDLLVLHLSRHAPRSDLAFHLALHAPSTDVVDAFHRCGIGSGGTDSGAPGIRSQYLPTYYSAYLKDPDGHRVEAVRR